MNLEAASQEQCTTQLCFEGKSVVEQNGGRVDICCKIEVELTRVEVEGS